MAGGGTFDEIGCLRLTSEITKKKISDSVCLTNMYAGGCGVLDHWSLTAEIKALDLKTKS